MSHLAYRERPRVTSPIMICAFAGWNDGGEGATTTARLIREQWGARRFASIDPEDFYDFQVQRPTVRLVGGETRRIDWPRNDFSHGRVGERDLVVFQGVEPNTRWRTYCDQVLRVCTDLGGVDVLVTLGAFLADVPHTRPAPVTAASSDPRWSERHDVVPARYEGPTGIVGVLNDRAARAGVPSLSLWAASPHYLPQSTNPKVALALMERLRDLLGIHVETSGIERSAVEWEREVTEAIEEDGNLAHYVRRLEEAIEESEGFEAPSGEDLAAELERYLREHDGPDE